MACEDMTVADWNFRDGNYEQALLWYDDLTRSHLCKDEAWFKKGLCYINLQKYDEALECFNNVNERSKYYSKATTEKDKCLVKLGKKSNSNKINTNSKEKSYLEQVEELMHPKSSSSTNNKSWSSKLSKSNNKFNGSTVPPGKKVCPECGRLINDYAIRCVGCNHYFKDAEDAKYGKINSELLNSVEALFDGTKTYDDFFKEENVESCKLINFWKSQGVPIEQILMCDLVDWLCYLGLGDGVIVDAEINFIRNYFNLWFDHKSIMDLINVRIDENYKNNLPISFMVFHEIESYLRREGDLSQTEFLLSMFKYIGWEFINCDGDVHPNEVHIFNEYIDILNINMDRFKNEYNYTADSIVSYWNSAMQNQNMNNSNSFESDNNTNIQAQSTTQTQTNTNISKVTINQNASLEGLLNELNSLVGLNAVKNEVNSLVNLIQIRKIREERGMNQPPMSLHLVFSGNPGTGKTTVARILAEVYCQLGLLTKGHLVETDRSGLVGGYLGQTAIKTQQVIQEAMGGVLFIDEAYTLAPKVENDTYGQEAIDTILKAMEDNRDNLIVIVAGYPDLMGDFIKSNPGLESRFNKYIFFDDYNPDELYGIFLSMCEKSNLILDAQSETLLRNHFNEVYRNRGDNFANGRYVRNIFENVLTNQANRLATNLNISNQDLMTLTIEDFRNLL